jgi:outer membrane lipoprotein carrier protein
MKKLFLHCVRTALLAALVLVPANASAAPAAVGVDEAVKAIEEHYQALSDLTAHVVQKNRLKSLDKTQTFEGELLIKKPGKLRLQYTNDQLIVLNGRSVLFYSKKSEQVVKKTFTDFEHMNIPVAFLLGAAHIRTDFEILQPDPERPYHLELIPKKSGAVMTRLALVSDPTGRIEGLTIHDRSGNVTEIVFSSVREDTGVKDKVFQFKPPKGTEVIEQ